MKILINKETKTRGLPGCRQRRRTLMLLLAIATASGCAVTDKAPEMAPGLGSWQEVRSWPFDDTVKDLALANDGSFLVIAANTEWEPRGIVMLDGETGEVNQILPDDNPPSSVAVSPDGSTIVGSWPGRLAIFKSDGTPERDIPYQRGNQLRAFFDIAFTPDGKGLVGVADDVAWVSVETGEFIYERPIPTGGRSLAVLADTTVAVEEGVAIGLINKNEASPRCLVPLEAPGDVAVSPDGSRFAAARFRAGFSVWNSSDCGLVSSWSTDAFSSSIAWLPDNQHLVASSSTGTLQFWDTNTGELANSLQVNEGSNFLMAMTPDARTLVTIDQSGEGPIILWRSGGD